MMNTEAKEVYLHAIAQMDLNLDFGNIALTYVGGTNDKYKVDWGTSDASKLFAYFGLTAIENLGLDVGIGFPFPNKGDKDTNDITVTQPISAGLGVKFAMDAFGVKFCTVASFAGNTKDNDSGDKVKDPFALALDILPFYKVSDSLCIFFSADIAMNMPADNKDVTGEEKGDTTVGFHIIKRAVRLGSLFLCHVDFFLLSGIIVPFADS
jgi:hypothetical protein